MHPFAERIPEDNALRTLADSAFSAVDGFRRKVAEIKGNRKLSSEGHLDAIRAAAEAGPRAYFAALRKQLDDERKSLAKRQAHFHLPVPDRDDVVLALDRQEIRAWLRTLPIGERIKHAASDPTVAAAVVNAPPALAGLNEDGHERAKAFLMEHMHGPELAQLRGESDAVETAGKAIDIAENQLLNEYEPAKKPEPGERK